MCIDALTEKELSHIRNSLILTDETFHKSESTRIADKVARMNKQYKDMRMRLFK